MLTLRALLIPAAAALVATGCGGGEEAAKDPVQAVQASKRDEVREAQTVDVSAFPKASGDSLEAFGGQFDTQGPQATAASTVFHPGKSERLAFALLDTNLKFTYGKTVVYLQRRNGGPITGPFAAPADVLLTDARYRSKQAASEKDPFAAIYTARVPIKKPGIWNALAVSDLGDGRRIAAGMSFQAVSKAQDKVPDAGEKAPPVETDTVGSVKGNTDLLDTRVPPAPELHRSSFADVVGKEPVALLFASPQLCQSRVCGPVVDQMIQLKAKYGDRMQFIYQEPYADNDVNKGLRPPMLTYSLPTEPWLFTVRRDGTIAARLEGSFGLRSFEDAIKSAL